MRILIVTTRFFPYGSATSGVVGNLAQALIKKGCEVKIVALTRFKESEYDSLWHDIPVHLEYAPSTINKEQALKEWKSHFFRTCHGVCLRIIDKLIQVLSIKYKKYSINYSLVKAYKSALNKEISDNFDICIATLMPIEAVYATSSVKRKNKRFGIYQLDPYWNNADLPDQFIEDRKEFEYKLVMESDLCMTTPLIENVNTNIFPLIKKKYLSVEFPCLKCPSVEKIFREDSNIHCVFVGMLYTEIRPPEKVVDIIAALGNQHVVFDFYGDGQNLVEQSKNYKMVKQRIRLYGVVSSEEAERKRVNADFLVNIDNTSTALVPSKIFEYISVGKPIINFYFSKESYTLKYLEKYPFCLNIYLGDQPKKNANIIDAFIKSNKDKSIDFDQIKELYRNNTPEFVSEQCINWLETH